MAVDKVIIEYQLKTDQLRKELDEVKAQMGMVEKEGVKTTNNLSNNFQELGRNIANAFAIREIILFSKEATKLASTVESLNVQLKFVLGSQEAANDAMKFARNVATELALDIQGTTASYTKFVSAAKTSGMELNQANKVFKAVATASRAMNLSVEQTEGVFYSLQQMISKGNVQAEELRGQLGERLPGAFSIAARSIGVTEKELNKMLETGQVVAKDFLPAFAEELQRTFEPAIADSLETYNAKLTEFNNKLYDVKVSLGTDLMPVLTEFFDILMKGWDGASDAINRYFAFFGNKVALDNIQNETLRENTAAILEQGLSYEELGKQIAATDAALLEHAKNNTVYNYKTNIFGKKVTDGLNESYVELQDNYYALVEAQKITGATMTETTEKTERTGVATEKTAKKVKLLDETMAAFAENHSEGKPSGVDYMIEQLLKSYQKLTTEVTDILPDLSKQEDIFNEIGFSGLALNPVVLNLTEAYKEGRITLDQYIDSVKELKEAQDEGGDTTNDYLDDMIRGFGAANELFGVYSMLLTDTANKQSALADFGRQLAFFEIATAQAVAIANAVKTVSGSSLNAIDYFIALTSILSSIGVTIGRAKGLIEGANAPKFAKGVVDLQGEGTETSDSIWARLSKGESVITAKGTKQDKGLFKAANKMQLQEYINQNYVLPMMLRKEGEKQSAFDDYRLYLAMMNNQKAVKEGSRQVVDAIKRRSRRYDWN